MARQQTRTRWGQAKFGGGRIPAVLFAIPGGLLLGAAGGWLAVGTGLAGSSPLLGFAVFTACLAMPAMALMYVLVVDRSTVEGAVDRPEESVEGKWYDKAASGSFTDLVLVLGVLAAVAAFVPADLAADLKLVLPAILAVCFASFGIRYLVLRLRG